MRTAILTLIVVLSVRMLSIAAQPPAYTVHGIVTAPPHLSATAAVRVRLERLGIPVQEIFLRENRFDIWGVERGHYTLVVSAPDYEILQQEIDVPGETAVIALRPNQKRLSMGNQTVPVWTLKIPKSAQRQFQAATRELGQSKCVEALEYLKKAVQIYAEYGDAHHAMAECYSRTKQVEAAEQEFKRALELPHEPDLHLSLGLFYLKDGRSALFRRQMQLYGEEVATHR